MYWWVFVCVLFDMHSPFVHFIFSTLGQVYSLEVVFTITLLLLQSFRNSGSHRGGGGGGMKAMKRKGWMIPVCCFFRLMDTEWLCSHAHESRSERLYSTWYGPFLIWKPDFSPCECNAVSNQAFETHFETRKKRAFWIVIRLESLILGHVNAKLFRNVIRACAFLKCARTAQ